MGEVELGSGLIAIGRPWGTTPEVPSEQEAQEFLVGAYQAGLRIFDTAPSYGLSEERLGRFLGNLTREQRSGVTVATKFGEHWDEDAQKPYTDHTEKALKRSVDQSQRRLGMIALLQLHKASTSVLWSKDFERAMEYARSLGITEFGASVSDTATADAVAENDDLKAIQLPYNQSNPKFNRAISRATWNGLRVWVSRPFQMGQALEAADPQQAAVAAFRYILSTPFDGVVLSGTSNLGHLQENIAAFQEAKAAQQQNQELPSRRR